MTRKKSRLFLLFMVHLFCLLTLVTLAWSGQPQSDDGAEGARPTAVFPQTQWKFKPVFEGEQIKHDFFIENHGKVPLMIQNVRPD
jgi:hypothetical protein